MRMCIDYRKVNSIKKKDSYPLPRIDEIIDDMGGASIFSKLVLAQGYHQIRIRPEYVPKTAFQTQFRSFQFRVMPFGLCNAPATFQRTMNVLLADCRAFARVYLDYILIYSHSLEEHAKHVRIVLEKLWADKPLAKLKKCL